MPHESLFLFDIDGTLLKGSTIVHREAFRHAYREVYGLDLTLDGIAAGGRTDSWLLAEPLRRWGMSEDRIAQGRRQAFDVLEAYVEEHLGDLRDKVLPGVPDVLEMLHRSEHVLGLLTGNLTRIAWAKMRMAGLEDYFDTGGFGEESEVRAHLVPVALRKAGETAPCAIAPQHSVVIGDTPLDIEAAHICGLRAMAVATGPFSVAELEAAGADVAVPSLAPADVTISALLKLTLDPQEPPD